jgi:hypothetical protein
VSTRYTEITLDTTSATVINSIPALDNRLSKSTGGFLQASFSVGTATSPNNEVGMVLIHTRKSASMLAVSSQEIVVNSNSLLSEYVGNAWYQTCIDTYGLTDEVPLDPSFPDASVTSVTANGSAVSDGDSLTGSQVLRIYGSNLSTRNVVFKYNDVVFSPLSVGVDYMEYLLTFNGSADLIVNGRQYMQFDVGGITPIEGFPIDIFAAQEPTKQTTFGQEGSKNYTTQRNVYCSNFPYRYDAEAPYFLFSFEHAALDEGSFEGHNCVLEAFQGISAYTRVSASVVDNSEPAWLTYDGVVVAVFNYS